MNWKENRHDETSPVQETMTTRQHSMDSDNHDECNSSSNGKYHGMGSVPMITTTTRRCDFVKAARPLIVLLPVVELQTCCPWLSFIDSVEGKHSWRMTRVMDQRPRYGSNEKGSRHYWSGSTKNWRPCTDHDQQNRTSHEPAVWDANRRVLTGPHHTTAETSDDNEKFSSKKSYRKNKWLLWEFQKASSNDSRILGNSSPYQVTNW